MTPFKDNITKSIDNLNKLQEDVDNTITDLQEQVVDLEEQVEEMENLETKDVTITTNTETTIEPTTGKYALDKVVVTTNVQPNLEEKSVTITENTTTNITPSSGYDGLSSVAVTTNIQSGNGVLDTEKYNYIASVGNPSRLPTLLKSINLNCTSITTFENCFKDCNAVTSITLTNVNTTDNINFYWTFYGCTSLTDLNIENISNIKISNLTYCFYNCSSLITLGEINLNNVSTNNCMQNAFSGCTSLSNDSLHNIIKAMSASDYIKTYYTSYNKKLSHIGLTSEQATTCTSFNEWTTLSTAGWSTGY